MSKVKVLIIDDEADFCENIGAFFQNAGHTVYIAGTLLEGLRILEEHSIQVLFLDNNLPDGEGWEQTPTLLTKYPFLKINLISAFKEYSPDLDKNPNVKVWEKPLSLKKLLVAFN